MNKKQKGNLAEMLARMVLRLKFYRIIEQNYITGRGFGCGEIDIVALKGKTIVFAEVKERQDIKSALYAIKPAQQKRILRAAEVYLARHREFRGYDVRFDAIFVARWHLKHYKNAFQMR